MTDNAPSTPTRKRRTYTERGRDTPAITPFEWEVGTPDKALFKALVEDMLNVGKPGETSSRDAEQITGVNYVTVTAMLKDKIPSYETIVRFTWAMGGNMNQMLEAAGYRPWPTAPIDMARLGLIPEGFEWVAKQPERTSGQQPEIVFAPEDSTRI